MALAGLNDYLKENYTQSVFDAAFASQAAYLFHLHHHRIFSARVQDIQKYDITLDIEKQGSETLPKLDIKYICEKESAEAVCKMMKTDTDIAERRLEAILSPAQRHHIKNKTLYPLMKDRTVLFVSLLEGEVFKGIVAGFSKYEITFHLKGGTPVTIMRHAIYDVLDKKGRCYLKRIQQQTRDWKNSAHYVTP